MQHVRAMYSTNQVITGGIDMWWSAGEELYTYQQWVYAPGSKSKFFTQVNVDPMYGNDLRVVARESWNGTIHSYSPDYKG